MSSAIRMTLVNGLCLLLFVTNTIAENKYSATANKPKDADSSNPFPVSLRELDRPYRIAKLNLLWAKAKHRLTEPKLQSLFSDLKIHDKEEIVFKHIKADGMDPEGLQEATLRKKLIGIMSTYGLLEHFAETDDPELLKRHKALNDGSNYVAKDLFKDKKLNKLWAKAEVAGFTSDELDALKEEFTHHQEKVDEYMSLLQNVHDGDTDTLENSIHGKAEKWNMIETEEEQNDVPGKNMDYLSKANLLREKHLELRSGFDRLDRLAAKGPNHKEFVEPKVQGLWRVALEAKFSPEELESLKEELLHYESRLLKLRHLHTEAALEAARKGKPYDLQNSTVQQHIKKHTRTVEKLHMDIETKIMQKHIEL
ncbi:alpha-2-macroglobulin receptor-associated protein [Cephus cinctus]|uniref:Alpha-2-macroglobulin receptor-associated protein n=1 Tax=Cephus cinctus TaxID=211228 RepID=A0AAJ7BZQ9_CEPCN|nr:alpha-2-macroglobulin receptor-associated protein [Cephus cinctus]